MKIFTHSASKLKKRFLQLGASLCALVLMSSCANAATTTSSSAAVTTTTAAATTTNATSATSTAAVTTSTTTQAAATPSPKPTTPQGVLDPAKTNLRGEEIVAGESLPRVMAVMLDNHPDARYQAGLKDADIVFEMPVEGSFTRYMALFQSKYPEVVGPVRSAREQFLDRMLEFDAVYVHFGGSVPADKRIAAQAYETINGMVVDSQFWRKNDTGKVAPHNAYTDLADNQNYIKNRGWHEEAQFENYYFNTSAKKPGGETANDVIININSDNQTSYKFDAEKKIYLRYKNGDEDLDENNREPIEVSNIIIQNAKYYVYEATWQKIEQITKGDGYYISMGEMIPITWEKSEDKSLTRYYDKEGKELTLNPGQTWIQIVNLGVKPIVK